MIDKVRMNTIIDISPETLSSDHWQQRHSTRTDQPFYIHYGIGLKFKYYPSSQRLILEGRPVLSSIHPDLVTNLDAVQTGLHEVKVIQHHQPSDEGRSVSYEHLAASQNLDDLIDFINQYLNGLCGVEVDIREFQVTYIEICFNVYTEYYEHYIEIFNKIFMIIDPSQFTNFVLERKKSIQSSFYIKTRSDYRDSVKRRTVVNYYNKSNQLQNKLDKANKDANDLFNSIIGKRDNRIPRPLSGKAPPNMRKLVDIDTMLGLDAVNLSKNNLRMEIQLSSKVLYDIFGSSRPFQSFLDINVCKNLVIDQYRNKLSTRSNPYLDFFTFKAAMKKIEDSDMSRTIKNNLSNTLRSFARDYKLTPDQFNDYKTKMASLGMHWYIVPERLMPTEMKDTFLESPIKLLEKIIEDLKSQAEKYSEKQKAIQIEDGYLINLETADDSTFYLNE